MRSRYKDRLDMRKISNVSLRCVSLCDVVVENYTRTREQFNGKVVFYQQGCYYSPALAEAI